MTAATKGEIHHPLSGKSAYNTHFAAFGLADKGARVRGTLSGQDSQTATQGCLVYFKPSKQDPSRMFWVLEFQVKPARDELYTLRIYDDGDGHELGSASNDLVLPARMPASAKPQSAGSVTISYPGSNDTSVPLEFTAYGTATGTAAVTGTMSNCDPTTDIAQQTPPFPPLDWNLYCDIVDPNPPCTLTVTQSGVGASATGLSFV